MNDFRTYSAAFQVQQNDLQHYGVLGMKWGIRRDRQLMAERRYNKAKDNLKNKYELGEMSKEEYKTTRKAKKKEMKNAIKEGHKESNSFKNKAELEERFKKVRKQAINEIPKYRLQAGAYTASRVLRGLGTGAAMGKSMFVGAALGASMGGPVGVMAGIVSGAFSAGIDYGISRVGKRVDNKIRRQINR